MNIKHNVSKLFMRMIDKHFPHHHKFHKLFNRNNVKLSYSCMSSMKNVIQTHNSKIMEHPKPTNNKTCSCCWLQSDCCFGNWKKKSRPYICEKRKCDLCLCEKLMIPRANSASLLNKRDEIVSKCGHMNNFTMKCFKNK